LLRAASPETFGYTLVRISYWAPNGCKWICTPLLQAPGGSAGLHKSSRWVGGTGSSY